MGWKYKLNYPRGAKKRSKKLRSPPRNRWKGDWNEFADIVKAEIATYMSDIQIAPFFLTVEAIAERLWYKEGNIEKAFMILNQRGLLSQRRRPYFVHRLDGWVRNSYVLTPKFVEEIKTGG